MKNGAEDKPGVPSGESSERGGLSLEQRKALVILQRSKAFADMVSLLMSSESHRHIFLSDLEWALLPALARRQFRIFSNGNQPVAFALWAELSPEVEKDFLSGRSRLRPTDWKSGDRLWLIELVVPGKRDQKITQGLLKELATGPFSGRDFYTIGRDPKTGKLRQIRVSAKAPKEELRTAAASQREGVA